MKGSFSAGFDVLELPDLKYFNQKNIEQGSNAPHVQKLIPVY